MALFNSPVIQDPLFPNANERVWQIKRDGDILYVAGGFTEIGGVPKLGLAAVHAITGEILPVTYFTDLTGWVHDLVIVGSIIYAVGNFRTFTGGFERIHAIAFNKVTGGSYSWDPGLNDSGYGVVCDGSTVFIGGAFTKVNTGTAGSPVDRSKLASFNMTSAVATAWDPTANGLVNAIQLSGNTLYAVGEFTSVGSSTTRNHAAAFSKYTGGVEAWNPNITGLTAYALCIHDSSVYIGGDFSAVDGVGISHLAKVDSTTGAIDTAFDAKIDDGSVLFHTLEVFNDQLLFGGNFTSVNSQPRLSVADANLATGALGNLIINTATPGLPVFSLVGYGQKIYRGMFAGAGSELLTAWWSVPPPPPEIREGTPEKPVISFLLRKDGQTLLKWQTVFMDVYQNRINVSGYRVYRSTNKNLESYELVKEIVSVDVRGEIDTMFSEPIDDFYGYAVSAFVGPYEGEKAYVKAVSSTFDLDLFS